MHLIHIMHWLGMHPHAHAHFHYMRMHFPKLDHLLATSHHYKVWLDAYLHTHHRLPGDDLLLGS
jgi:hypothetical protein